MFLNFIKDIVKRGSDVDGLSATDREQLRRTWGKHISAEKIKQTLDIFSDLTIDRSEFRKLLELSDPIRFFYDPLASLHMRMQLRKVVGRFGRRARVGHMLAILRRVKSSFDKSEQLKLLDKIWQLNPTHELSLLKPLDQIVRDPAKDSYVVYLAATMWIKIHNGSSKEDAIEYVRNNEEHYLIRATRISPTLKKNKKFLAHCAKLQPSCVIHAHCSLKKNGTFARRIVQSNENNFKHFVPFLSKMPVVDAIGVIEAAIKKKPSLLKLAIPFLRSLPPIISALLAEKALKHDPDLLPHVFQFLYRMNSSYGLQRACLAASKSKKAYHFFQPWIKKMPQKKASTISIQLIKEDSTVLGLVLPILSKDNSRKAKYALAGLVWEKPTALRQVEHLFSSRLLNKLIHTILLKYMSDNELDTEAVPLLLPHLKKQLKSKNDKIRKAAEEALKKLQNDDRHKLWFIPYSNAIKIFSKQIKDHYETEQSNLIATEIPKKFISDVRVQELLLEKNFHEITWLVRKNPKLVHPTVKKKYDYLIGAANKLGVKDLRRFRRTGILRTIIKNRRNIDGNDGRPLALAMYPAADDNGAFTKDYFEAISQNYRLLYFEIDNPDAWLKYFERATRKQKASLVIVAGHGRRFTVLLEQKAKRKADLEISHIRKLKRLRHRIVPNGQILLSSCYTGVGSGVGEDVAMAFSEIFPQAFVHAPTTAALSPSPFIFARNGMVTAVNLHVRTLLLHKDSNTNMTYDPNNYPRVLNPPPSWYNPGKSFDPIAYKRYLLELGYKNGIQLFPKITLKQSNIIDRTILKTY